MAKLALAVQAEHHRGKAAGLYVDRLRLTGVPSDDELITTLEALLNKEIAEAVKVALGES